MGESKLHGFTTNIIDHDEKCSPSSSSSSSSSISSVGQESTVSNGSSISSSDVADDASSSFCSNSSRALYDLTEIMEELPIKRGLSKFYKGKSESFTSLSRVTSIEDLVKKATPYRRNLKASKSIGTGLHSCKSFTLPKPIITKRPISGCSPLYSKRGSFTQSKLN